MARSAFKFRLERLLDVRIMREKQAQQELLARRNQLANEQARLVQMQQEEVQLREDQREPLRKGDDLVQFQARRHFLEQAIKDKVQEQVQQDQRITDAERRVVEQQQVLKQAGIDVKALEKLKEKQGEEHRLEQLSEEAVYLDDLAGQGYLRRRTLAKTIEAEDAARAAAYEEPA